MTATTAIERTRELLDERGVKHEGGERSLRWRDRYGIMMQAFPLANGELGMGVWSCTPEQAVEATLGRGTCSIRGGECDQCGAHIHRDAVLFWVPAGGGMRTVESRDVSYCPNCGRKVEE